VRHDMTTTTACWSCGFENPAGARFCSNCGTPQRQPCPECGADVPEGSRFCPNCGIALTRKPAPAQAVLTAETRRVITVLFADLVGSTGLTERLDPEEARDVIKKFYDVAQHVVERWYEGSIANYLGDGILAVFGLPAAHENDPERAARAGLAIRDAMPNLNDHLRATHGVQLAVRIGINTGEVVAASGSTFERDFLVSDAVTTAARMQQNVAAGTIVVGERTYRLTKETIQYDQLPPIAVKGKEAPLAVWSAVAPLPESVEIRRITAPLVGRHAELGLLRHLYERSRNEGLIHLVTVLGQVGVGKSRLLREFLAEMRESDTPPLVLRGRSVGFGGQIGYHALLDILRAQVELLDTDSSDVVRSKIESWLHEVQPGAGALLDGLLLTFGIGEVGGDDPSLLRRRLFTAWKDLVLGLAAARPVVLALEDLHWADDGVLDLVQTITQALEQGSLFIICLARPELTERRPAWPGSPRNTTNIELRPLRKHEAEQLAAALGSDLTTESQQMVAQRAGGNPLFVEELVRMLLEGSTPGAAIPETVQAVLTTRIDRLEATERKVLQAAAVIGRSFWPSGVAPIAGLQFEEVAAAVQGLISKELVVARPHSVVAGEREYAFRHILTRDVAYGLLPRAQRQRAHAEAARWLEARVGDRIEEVVEILAEHLRVADDPRAGIYLHRAGNKARRLYANADAIRLYDQALEAAAEASLGIEHRAVIHLERGEVHQLRGDYAAAMTDFTQGLTMTRHMGDRQLEAMLENRVGLVFHRQLQLDDAQTHYRNAAQIAREIGNRLVLGQSLVDLANISWDRGRVDPDESSFMEGLALLREAGDLSVLARGLNMLAMSHLRVGNGDQAIAAAEEARRAAEQAGDKSKEATSLSYLTVINLYLGRYDEAIRHGQAALTIAQQIEDHRRTAYAMDFVARVQLSVGKWGEAIQLLQGSLPRVREFARGYLPWALMWLGIAFEEIGDLERAAAHFRECAAIDRGSATFWQPIVISRAVLAKLTKDRDLLARVIHEMDTLPWDEFIPGASEPLLPVGETFVEFGAYDALERLVKTRRASAERLGAPPYLAAFQILHAHLASQRGNRKKALAHIEHALTWSNRCGYVITERHALELGLKLHDSAAERERLRNLLQRLAASLPEALRATFLASPRVAGVLADTS
jgi:class 3 adenylate cyclase/tetratricopeptide (TPR) repeat protein